MVPTGFGARELVADVCTMATVSLKAMAQKGVSQSGV